MPDPVISLDGVSKRFTIVRRRGPTLKDRTLGLLTGRREHREALWALRDVTLEVRPGETMAVIGPNGCGKSTLLQLVAGILVPDGGRVSVTGRVTSLLELGAGFSPDLSGRENIFLNASLHGVSRAEAASRFDRIVEFAELERFIDTPVRNYSSGMYMRLGFSVAVHLDPQAILVDEAFAVGDESFQRKCLRKLKSFQQAGVTIVLVSHDLSLVEQFATRTCLLGGGLVERVGAPADVIARYHELAAAAGGTPEARRWGDRTIEIIGVEFLSAAPGSRGVARTREPFTLRLSYRAHQRLEHPVFGLAFYHEDGTHLSGPNTKMSGLDIPEVSGDGQIEYRIDSLPFLPGRYLVSAAVYDSDLIEPYDHRDRFASFTVVEGGSRERFGVIELPARWVLPGASLAH